MGIDDKVSNAAEGAVGKAKEVAGDITGNKNLEAEGVKEQLVAKAKKAGETIKDFAEEAKERVEDALHHGKDKQA